MRVSIHTPYSLGKLVDWKLYFRGGGEHLITTPYSLGKLVDWKHPLIINELIFD